MRKTCLRSTIRTLLMLAFALLLTASLLAGLAGCDEERAEVGVYEDDEHEIDDEAGLTQEDTEDTYKEGKIEVLLDTDALWGESQSDPIPQGEALDTATAKIYELAARHNCTVEEFELLGPYGGAIVEMGLPEGKDEETAIAEFLEEPLVTHAYRIEDTD